LNLYPKSEQLLFESFNPYSFNIFHAICKKFSENNLKDFINLLSKETLNTLAFSLARYNSIDIAPIHIIALFQPGPLIIEVLQKLDVALTLMSEQEQALLAKCLQDNPHAQDYHKNYIYNILPSLNKPSSSNLKINLPADDFLDLTNSSALSIEALLIENEKFKKENVMLQEKIEATWTSISNEISALPIFSPLYSQPEENISKKGEATLVNTRLVSVPIGYQHQHSVTCPLYRDRMDIQTDITNNSPTYRSK
jgi:hypothetical protein